jgi:hypothetical protein
MRAGDNHWAGCFLQRRQHHIGGSRVNGTAHAVEEAHDVVTRKGE